MPSSSINSSINSSVASPDDSPNLNQGQPRLNAYSTFQGGAEAVAVVSLALFGQLPNPDEMRSASASPINPINWRSQDVSLVGTPSSAFHTPTAAQVAMASAAATPDGLIELEGDAPRVPATVKYKAGYQVAAGWGTPTQVRSTSLADHLEHRRLTGSPVVLPAANTDNHTASSAPGRLGGRASQVNRPLVWDDPFGS